MNKVGLKFLKSALIGAFAGVLLITVLMLAGPYPEGTSVISVIEPHVTLLAYGGAVGAVVALFAAMADEFG